MSQRGCLSAARRAGATFACSDASAVLRARRPPSPSKAAAVAWQAATLTAGQPSLRARPRRSATPSPTSTSPSISSLFPASRKLFRAEASASTAVALSSSAFSGRGGDRRLCRAATSAERGGQGGGSGGGRCGPLHPPRHEGWESGERCAPDCLRVVAEALDEDRPHGGRPPQRRGRQRRRALHCPALLFHCGQQARHGSEANRPLRRSGVSQPLQGLGAVQVHRRSPLLRAQRQRRTSSQPRWLRKEWDSGKRSEWHWVLCKGRVASACVAM